MNDSKQATGRVIKPGHDCKMPTGQTVDAVFRCDCGRYWQMRAFLGGRGHWRYVPPVEAIFRGWNKL